MARFEGDQAEGLRRLLVPRGTRVLVLTSGCGAVGKTGIAANLAAALADGGREVLLLDESLAGAAAQRLGLRPKLGLHHALRGDATADDVLLRADCGVSVLPAGRALAALAAAHSSDRERARDWLARLGERFDTVLVDAAGEGCRRVLPHAAEEVVVMSPASAAITQGYAMVKRLSADWGKRRFHVVLNRARSRDHARALFDNMAEVAQGYLSLDLEFLGDVPFDEKLRRSGELGRPVLELFPACPAASAFRRLAGQCIAWSGAAPDAGCDARPVAGLEPRAAANLRA